MTIQRMEHVGIVVDDLAAVTAFFVELGLKLQGEGPVEGGWVDRVVGLEGRVVLSGHWSWLRGPIPGSKLASPREKHAAASNRARSPLFHRLREMPRSPLTT
jgi:catechol 2,3-dioxygenase-like lactoylglutathione lyase family enzyme